MKKLSYLFLALAVALSDMMCLVVAYYYRDMLCGIEHSCYSAPAAAAFLYAIGQFFHDRLNAVEGGSIGKVHCVFSFS